MQCALCQTRFTRGIQSTDWNEILDVKGPRSPSVGLERSQGKSARKWKGEEYKSDTQQCASCIDDIYQVA